MKYKFDLQLFAEAVQGKKIVYLYRILEDAATDDGALIAFTTENGRTKSKDADSTATKDGSIRTPGVAEVEITATSILSVGDTMIGKLESALDNDKVTELEISSSAEDFAEVSLTFGINGGGKDGEVTVSAEQQAVADYVFKDTSKTGA